MRVLADTRNMTREEWLEWVGAKEIILTQGKMAIVDDEDYEYLSQFKWYANKQGNTYYAVRTKWLGNGKQTSNYMHRVVAGDNPEVRYDHANGDSLDNRKSNLRVATWQENARNARPQDNRSSIFKGVSFDNRCNKWRSRIMYNGKELWLGRYDHEADAAKVYDGKARELFGEYARLNFPEEEVKK